MSSKANECANKKKHKVAVGARTTKGI